MEKYNSFSILTNSRIISDISEMKRFCKINKTYKFLSLLLFNNVRSIECPSSVLITTNKIEILNQFFSHVSFPLMVRLDYSTYPYKKFLGGIEVKSISDLIEINKFIFEKKCFTLVHPYFNRLENDFNVGLLFLRSEDNVIIEYLGVGFDAGDLRLGKITPHEIKQYSLTDNKVQILKVCTKKEYKESREIRIKQIKRLLTYQNYVTLYHKLVENIEELDLSVIENEVNFYPPMEYHSINKITERKLLYFSHSLKRMVNQLPESDTYVASLSLNSNKLLLWDIYGKWYKR